MSQTTSSQVTVLRADSTSSLASVNGITNAIRNRAAQIAQGAASGSGNAGSGGGNSNAGSGSSGTGNSSGNSSNDATSNWLRAERDLFNVPEATLTETDQQFSITVSAAGCDAGTLQVIATANSLMVLSTAGAGGRSMNTRGNIVYSDVDSRTMFRRFDLPSSIDNSQVTVSLDNGILSIAAQKAAAGNRRSSAANA